MEYLTENPITAEEILPSTEAITTQLESLATLVKQRIKQRKPDLHKVWHFKSRRVEAFVQIVFRENSFLTALIYILGQLGTSTLLELIPMSESTINVLATIALALTTFFLAIFVLFTAEQIGRLIHRTASYSMMLELYFAIVFIYALIYYYIEQLRPNSFENITRDKSCKVLRSLQLYLDCLYFSNMCQSAVGFGDVSPYYTIGRLFVTSEMIVSVGFLSILFSNWIM